MVLCLEAREILVPIMNDTHLGRWLKSHREEKKLTQMELAYAAGTTPATISRIEKGNQGATEKRVVQIATALGADPREALEALMADTPGLEPLPEMTSEPDGEYLQDSIMAYTGTNPILNAAAATARSMKELFDNAGPALTGDEPKEELVRGRRKGITKVDGK